MSLICEDCDEWHDNIQKVTSPFQLLTARNPHTYKGYDGKQFKYCPWCSNLLQEDSLSTPDEEKS